MLIFFCRPFSRLKTRIVRWFSTGFSVRCISLLCLTILSGPVAAKAQIALILDDMGYRLTDTEALKLPAEVAFAILPDTPLALSLSEQAHVQGRDTMLHLPMESEHGNRLGPQGLTTDMYADGIRNTLNEALKSVPYAVGVNNHMGSLLTREVEPMTALMQALKGRQLFFLDSRTTPQSVAEQIARQSGLPTASRHVFLDHQLDTEFMQRQFVQLAKLARRRGTAIGIAHPHPQTLKFLNIALGVLAQTEIELVPVSQLFAVPASPEKSDGYQNPKAIAPQ